MTNAGRCWAAAIEAALKSKALNDALAAAAGWSTTETGASCRNGNAAAAEEVVVSAALTNKEPSHLLHYTTQRTHVRLFL